MTREWTRRTAVASVLLVALVAAVCSYAHMQALAERSGEAWRSWIIPLSVDGMLVASTLAIVDRRRAGLAAGWVPWFGLSLGILASLAANVAAARPDSIARIIAAWPPVAFAVAVETLVIVLRGTAADASLHDTYTYGHDEAPDFIPLDIPAAPVAPSDDLLTRARALGPGAGRRTVARTLGVSDYKARTLLERLAQEAELVP